MMQRARQLIVLLTAARRRHPILFWVRCAVVLGAAGFFVVERDFWTPDTLFIGLLIIAIAFGQARPFIYRFLPFVAVLLVYDSFRGIADNLNASVHYLPMINVDHFLFGGALPTTVLQHWLWHGSVQWYDFYFYFLYTIHFAMPILLAVLIWKVRDSLYWPFVVALVMLSFGAFITYILFPAAPPWLAAQNGYIPALHRISSDVWYAMGVTNFSEIYSKLSPNEVAAVPSLHAAYPTLFLLFTAKLFGWRRMWWLAIYPLSVWLGVVYLGEHYVTDVILGVLYATCAYKATFQLFAWKARRGWRIRTSLRRYGQRIWAVMRSRPLDEE